MHRRTGHGNTRQIRREARVRARAGASEAAGGPAARTYGFPSIPLKPHSLYSAMLAGATLAVTATMGMV